MAVRVSVVVATYNRQEALERLLRDLAAQRLAPSEFEVVVVDDGSRTPVRPLLDTLALPYRLVALAQDNAGQAVARHRGIQEAQGEVVVIVDDDMRLPEDFLTAHLSAHDQGAEVVLGAIDPGEDRMPLFERWHAYQLARFARSVEAGRVAARGVNLATGNVSFSRRRYLELGGFDPALKRSEDRELGVRFEKAGAPIGFSARARSLHQSDHESLERWWSRAVEYGIYDARIARKHPDHEDCDPWKFLARVSPLSRPFLLFSAAWPRGGEVLGRTAMGVARIVDGAGAERVAFLGTTFAYGLAYFEGVRTEAGSLTGAARGLGRWFVKRGRERLREGRPSALAAGADLVAALREDFEALRRGRAKYGGEQVPASGLPAALVSRIGLQMMAGVRVMRLLRDAGVPLGPQLASRLIRHLYGAEIHWDAEFAPGVTLVHGNGLVVSHAARIGAGCVLFHNVTLGLSADPRTGVVGAPVLGREVHVMPGATLLGPIVVGDGTKIMAGALLSRSVPARSLVGREAPEVHPRGARPPGLASRPPRAAGATHP